MRNDVLCRFLPFAERGQKENDQIADVLEKILQTGEFMVENSDAVWQSLGGYRSRKADFADLLLGRLNKSAGYPKTATFDKKAGKMEEFELVAG